MSNQETNPNISQDDAKSVYHKGLRTPLHGPNGANASEKLKGMCLFVLMTTQDSHG